MRNLLSSLVLGLLLAMGLYSAWQIHQVTGVIKDYNEESAEADWDTPEYYSDEGVDPTPPE